MLLFTDQIKDLEKKLDTSLGYTRLCLERHQTITRSMCKDVETLHKELTTVNAAYDLLKQFVSAKLADGTFR
jgi:hypothetical protein